MMVAVVEKPAVAPGGLVFSGLGYPVGPKLWQGGLRLNYTRVPPAKKRRLVEPHRFRPDVVVRQQRVPRRDSSTRPGASSPPQLRRLSSACSSKQASDLEQSVAYLGYLSRNPSSRRDEERAGGPASAGHRVGALSLL